MCCWRCEKPKLKLLLEIRLLIPKSIFKSAPDKPGKPEATEQSYVDAVKVLGKYFLRTLDEWPDFDKEKDWREYDLGNALYDRSVGKLPEELKRELTGAQVGLAAHVAYQAYINP